MQIVIDIQDDVYRVLKENIYPIPDTERLALVFKTLVEKGTPLPKGHGRLIDADKIEYFESSFLPLIYSDIVVRKEFIDAMPTILDADKEIKNESNN